MVGVTTSEGLLEDAQNIGLDISMMGHDQLDAYADVYGLQELKHQDSEESPRPS